MYHSTIRFMQAVALGNALLLSTAPAKADAPVVVASIKPLHALAASIMRDVGSPVLLIEGASSPHGASLKPSAAQNLSRAKAVFWVGPALEAFLEKPLSTLAQGTEARPLIEAEGVVTLPFREHHDEHDQKHEHERENEHKHEHEHEHEHEHAGEIDPHIWLNPDNATAMGNAMAATLSKVDPNNAATYKKNAERLAFTLKSLGNELEARLRVVRDKPYLVAHDSFQYFEKRFGLSGEGVLSINPEVAPSVKRISEARHEIEHEGVVCVFREPQMPRKIVDAVIEGTQARMGTLDPIGQGLEPGPDAYIELMRANALSMITCLKG